MHECENIAHDEKLAGGRRLNMVVTTERIYRDKELALASFLGGPLAIGYLIAENFKASNSVTKRASYGWPRYYP